MFLLEDMCIFISYKYIDFLLGQATKKNKRDREDDRYHEPEMIDGQMLWFIMHHFRRSARRRVGF